MFYLATRARPVEAPLGAGGRPGQSPPGAGKGAAPMGRKKSELLEALRKGFAYLRVCLCMKRGACVVAILECFVRASRILWRAGGVIEMHM